MKEIIRFLRTHKSLSQEQVAQKLGISRQSYIKYENGQVTPNNQTITELSKLFGVSEEVIRSNKIPEITYENHSLSDSYKKYSQASVVKEPAYVYGTEASKEESYEGVFDGQSVQFTTQVNFQKGQRFKLVPLVDEEKERKRKEAFEYLMSISGKWKVPDDWDYKEELNKYREERFR